MNKQYKLTILLLILAIVHPAIARINHVYFHCFFTENHLADYEEGRCGTSLVKLDSLHECTAFFYTGIKRRTTVHRQQLDGIEWVMLADSSYFGCIYYGRVVDGTFFVEKRFNNRPAGEGILFSGIPEDSYEKLIQWIKPARYLPLNLFKESFITLLDYNLLGVCIDSYEEGRDGWAGVILDQDNVKWCSVYCFDGAMMATPLYLSRIDQIEYVNRTDSGRIDMAYSSPTGRMYYGKSIDGTYFVEKLFYANHQGIIFYRIPEEYYEDILCRLVSLHSLTNELFTF